MRKCWEMRQIEVDTDVFAAIWKSRKRTESNENQILRRILGLNDFSYDLPPVSAEGESVGGIIKVSKEVKHSNNESKGGALGAEIGMGKIRWVDDIQAVLKELGGRASLHNIYREVEKRRRAGGRSIPKTLEAVVRRTLEDHSSDSANFRGADLFKLVSRGEWELR